MANPTGINQYSKGGKRTKKTVIGLGLVRTAARYPGHAALSAPFVKSGKLSKLYPTGHMGKFKRAK